MQSVKTIAVHLPFSYYAYEKIHRHKNLNKDQIDLGGFTVSAKNKNSCNN